MVLTRIEETRTFPVSAEEAFDYITNPKTLELWIAGMIEVHDSDRAKWDEPGDRMRFAYRLLGKRLEGELLLEERRAGEYLKIDTDVPGVGTVTQQWFFSGAGNDRVTLKVIYDTAEPTNFFGKIIDRAVVPTFVQRDLRATMGNLEEIFTLGVTD